MEIKRVKSGNETLLKHRKQDTNTTKHE